MDEIELFCIPKFNPHLTIGKLAIRIEDSRGFARTRTENDSFLRAHVREKHTMKNSKDFHPNHICWL